MAYNWCEYLIFARSLRDTPAVLASVCKDETIKRNIVSRAYYSAFHHSKKYAELKSGTTFPYEHVHSEVQDWFRNNKEKEIFDALRELGTWRANCDYDDDVPGLNFLMREGLKDSGKIYYLIKSRRQSQHLPPI